MAELSPFESISPDVEPLVGIDYWIGIAGNLTSEVRRLEREKVQLAAALVQAAGGRIEVRNYDLDFLPEMELCSEKCFDRDSVVYVTRPRRKLNLSIPS